MATIIYVEIGCIHWFAGPISDFNGRVSITVIGAIFIRGLWHSKFNLNGLLNFFAGVLLALLLSLNTLLPLLEVYRGNTLISPVAMDLVPNASLILQPIYNGVASNSDIVLTMIAYAMLTGLIVFWTRLGAFTKLFACVALVYILIGTGLFPWDSIQSRCLTCNRFYKCHDEFLWLGHHS